MTTARDRAAANHARGMSYREGSPLFQACPQRKTLTLGIFFDGTNNNRYRDIPKKTHTNVVRLHSAYKQFEEKNDIQKKHYILGVGSLDYGLLAKQVATLSVLWGPALASVTVPSAAVLFAGNTAGDLMGKIGGAGGKKRLNDGYSWVKSMLGTVTPQDEKIIDIYGFSRGAALARTFANLVIQGLRDKEKVPNLTVRFVGVFDTVGSFGLPGNDDDPGQNMNIAGIVSGRVSHYTARHEYRANFPLTRCIVGNKAYPGAHSDVGGGYPPVDDDGRVNHLAYVAFMDMWRDSVRYGIAMRDAEIILEQDGFTEDLEGLRNKINSYAGTEPVIFAPESDYAKRREEFSRKYIHESGGAWWNYLNPNRNERRDRRQFTPKKLRLVSLPPDFKWE